MTELKLVEIKNHIWLHLKERARSCIQVTINTGEHRMGKVEDFVFGEMGVNIKNVLAMYVNNMTRLGQQMFVNILAKMFKLLQSMSIKKITQKNWGVF